MKTPAVCPQCHGPLLSTAVKLRNGSEIWKKTCADKLGHVFTCLTKIGDDDSLSLVGIMLNREAQLRANWDFERQKLTVHKGKPSINTSGGLEIPWFEPDLDAYDKLVDKIRKYITFS
jgi:hypothetical protein